MKVNGKDLASGVIFMGAGAFYFGYALKTLPIGQMLNMGPGYFPVLLSSLTFLVGLVVAISSINRPQETPLGVIPWRGIIMITLALLFFAVFLFDLGLFPVLVGTAMLTCFASTEMTIRRAILTSLALSVFCVAVFSYGIGLPIPIIGPWLGG